MHGPRNLDEATSERSRRASRFAIRNGCRAATPRTLSGQLRSVLYVFDEQGRLSLKQRGISPDYALLVGDIGLRAADRDRLSGPDAGSFYNGGKTVLSIQHKGWCGLFRLEGDDVLPVGSSTRGRTYVCRSGNILLPDTFLLEFLAETGGCTEGYSHIRAR